MPEVRAEELIVFKVDKAGLSQTQAAIVSLEGTRRGFLETQKKIIEAMSKAVGGQIPGLEQAIKKEEERRRNVQAIHGLMGMIARENAEMSDQVADYLRQVDQATEAGKEGAVEAAHAERERAQAIFSTIDMIKERLEGEKGENKEKEAYLKAQMQEVLLAKDAYLVKSKEREIKNQIGVASKRENELLLKEIGLRRQVVVIEEKDAKTAEKKIKSMSWEMNMLLKSNQMREQAHTTVMVGGQKMEVVNGLQGAISKKTGEWYGTLAKVGVWGLVAAAVAGVARHMQMMAAGGMQVSAHLRQGAADAEQMVNWTGRMQTAFGMSRDDVIELVKSLSEAGMNLGEIDGEMEKIYARQYLWGVESSKQVEFIRRIQLNTRTTATEASGLLDMAIATGRELDEWTVEEVVNQMGEFTKGLRGGKMDALTTMALFKTIASTAETVGGHMNVFAGMSKDARQTIMGMVGNMEDMSAQQLVFIARNYEFPKGIDTAAEQVQYLRKAFAGLVPGVDAMQAKAQGLGAILKGTVDLMPKGAEPVEVEFRMTELLTRMFPELAKAAPEMASKLVPLIPLMESGKDIQKDLLAIYKDAEAKTPNQAKMASDQLEEAKKTSLYGMGMASALNRLVGMVAVIISRFPGLGGAKEEIGKLRESYEKSGEPIKQYRMGGQLFQVGAKDMMEPVTQKMEDIRMAADVPAKMVEMGMGGPEARGILPNIEKTISNMNAMLTRPPTMPGAIPTSLVSSGEMERTKREMAQYISVVAKATGKTREEIKTRLKVNVDLTNYYNGREEDRKATQREVKAAQTKAAIDSKRAP